MNNISSIVALNGESTKFFTLSQNRHCMKSVVAILIKAINPM